MKQIRRLSAHALAAMGWDGYVEERLVGWDAKRSWDHWLAQVQGLCHMRGGYFAYGLDSLLIGGSP